MSLSVRGTPEVPLVFPAAWVNVDAFVAGPTGQLDSSAAIQRSLLPGATTVLFPGRHALDKTAVIRAEVRLEVGVGGWIDYKSEAKTDF